MKYLTTILLALATTFSVGCTSAVKDHNKETYDYGETLVIKHNGDLVVVKSREHNRTSSRRDADRILMYIVRDAIDPKARPHAVYPKQLEKLQLEKPAFERFSEVRHKKTGFTGTIHIRHQGFNEWVYKIYLDKDFENYEATGKSPSLDPRKYQEWDEKDILLLPVHKVPYDDPLPEDKADEATDDKSAQHTQTLQLQLVSYIAPSYESPFTGRLGGRPHTSPF